MTLFDLNKKVQAFDFDKTLKNLLKEKELIILDMNRDQMLSGLDSEGNDIRPYYSENPYFKSEKQSKAYTNWKLRESPPEAPGYPARNPDAPNLYINGYTHSKIELKVEDLKISTNNAFAVKVFSVHTKALGLMPENTAKLTDKILNPRLTEALQDVLK